MTKLDKDLLKDIRSDISKALLEISKKRGIESLTIGGISYSDNKFTTRITGISSKKAMIESVSPTLSNFIGKSFNYAGSEYKVVDFRPRSPKFPVIAEKAGKRFKFPISVVK